MNEITDQKRVKVLQTLFMFTYMVSYLTRINYGAIIVEISDELGIAASLLSLAVTGSFITYGTGQLLSGYRFLGKLFWHHFGIFVLTGMDYAGRLENGILGIRSIWGGNAAFLESLLSKYHRRIEGFCSCGFRQNFRYR